ncbi:lipoprotein insertase outer membrane protein LolB [Haliea sp. E17]|uniref:lipoprotein insertase outer membrane protein LolB n=1 Tax=Haliea sp. E17 TaxID=3401576 RepID=UPI003AACFA4C
MIRPLLQWPLLAGLVLLSACSMTRGPEVSAAMDVQRQAHLLALAQWQAQGKIALRSAEHSESGNLDWRQDGAHTHLQLSGPMGLSATTVDSDGRYLSVRQGDEVQRWSLEDSALDAHNPWQLPLASLHYWLKGIPAPDAPVDALQSDPLTRLPAQLQQQGWTVDYQDYGQFGGLWLPTRLQLQRADTRARIILRQWAFPATP